jgi:RNA polymerase sigma-70 factor, ECF subfamily
MSVHVQTYFSEAVLAEIPHLRAYARLMTNDVNKADREVEETLKRAMSIMDRMSKRADLRVQLLTVLRSFLIGSERSHLRQFTMLPATYERLNGPFRIGNGHSEGSLSLASALLYLDYEDREAVVLSTGVGFSHREAAKVCNCEVSVYDARLSRGLKQLTELLPAKFVGRSGRDDATVSQAFATIKVASGVTETAKFGPPDRPFQIECS